MNRKSPLSPGSIAVDDDTNVSPGEGFGELRGPGAGTLCVRRGDETCSLGRICILLTLNDPHRLPGRDRGLHCGLVVQHGSESLWLGPHGPASCWGHERLDEPLAPFIIDDRLEADYLLNDRAFIVGVLITSDLFPSVLGNLRLGFNLRDEPLWQLRPRSLLGTRLRGLVSVPIAAVGALQRLVEHRVDSEAESVHYVSSTDRALARLAVHKSLLFVRLVGDVQ